MEERSLLIRKDPREAAAPHGLWIFFYLGRAFPTLRAWQLYGCEIWQPLPSTSIIPYYGSCPPTPRPGAKVKGNHDFVQTTISDLGDKRQLGFL